MVVETASITLTEPYYPFIHSVIVYHSGRLYVGPSTTGVGPNTAYKFLGRQKTLANLYEYN